MTKDNCPCAPLYIKCKHYEENYADCAIHRLNFALYSALAQATNGVIKPYHCPNFQTKEKEE